MHIKAYQGETLPKEKLALVKPTVGVQILSVNGNRDHSVRTSKSLGYNDVEMALLPGTYLFELDYNDGTVSSRGSVRITLEARAGRKYLLHSNLRSGSFRPRFDDLTDRPDQWCALADSLNFKSC